MVKTGMRYWFFIILWLGASFTCKSQSDSFTISDNKIFVGQICEIPCFAARSLDKIEYYLVDTQCYKELVTFFDRFSDCQFEVQAHVDCRGSKEFNRDFSQYYAEAYSAFLVTLGVSSVQLKPKGYGESQLVTDCPCEKPNDPGYNCSEEQHKKNRRMVLKVLSTL